MTEAADRHHLIVLAHGLWGSCTNLARVESVIHHTLGKSNLCTFHTFAPTSFAHFKTYDGIEAIGEYLIEELFKHLEILHDEHGITITEISFIGYSLGGLVVRYVIGELFDAGMFQTIKPGFFTTFATPHLGVTFYENTILNYLGSYFLGRTGYDLFISGGKNAIVYKLSDPQEKYYKGLKLFKTKITIANVKFDRTVGFYSAFISQYDPFKDWNSIEPEYIPGLPTASLTKSGRTIDCLIVDLKKSKRLVDGEKNSSKGPAYKHAMFLVGCIVTVLFPIILGVSTFATLKSLARTALLSKTDVKSSWKYLYESIHKGEEFVHDEAENVKLLDNQDAESDDYNEDENLKEKPKGISHLTRSVVENGLNLLNDDYDDLALTPAVSGASSKANVRENYKIDLDFQLDYESKNKTLDNLLKNVLRGDLSNIPLTEKLSPLPFDCTRRQILNNLNTLDWIKIPVLLQNLNSHQSVIGRRGFERTPDCIPFLFLYSFLIEESLTHYGKQ